MSHSTDLAADLAVLAARDPSPLRSWPGDTTEPPPHAISLAPWAVAEAAELRQRYGTDVQLTVGAMSYPDAVLLPKLSEARARLDPAEVTVALENAASVRSGHVTTCRLLVTNHTAGELTFSVTHVLVVDAGSGAVVGGYAGTADLVFRYYVVAPGDTTAVPVRVGTDSFDPALGYAVPPGEWGLVATLVPIPDGSPARTPVLPLTVTP